jgi:hypothetical protein
MSEKRNMTNTNDRQAGHVVTPAKEDWWPDYVRVVEKCRALEAQNKALLACLKNVLPFIESAESAVLVGDEGCLWLVEEARALIQSVEAP